LWVIDVKNDDKKPSHSKVIVLWGKGKMLWLDLLVLSHAVLPQCVAPPIAPAPAPTEYKLHYVQLVTKSGSRTPLSVFRPVTHRGTWLCDSDDAYSGRIAAVPLPHTRRIRHRVDPRLVDYPISCGAGDLTVEGMDQLRNLGSTYHTYLIDKLHFLSPGYVNPTELFIRATTIDRSYRSAVSFLRGLYPPAMPDEFVTVTIGTSNRDVLRPSGSVCSEIAELEKSYEADEFPSDLGEIQPLLAPILQNLGFTSLDSSELGSICDWITTMHCHENVVENLTAQIVEKCRTVAAKIVAAPFTKKRGVGFSYGFREIFRVMNDAIAGVVNVKFSLFALHDRGLTALLVGLGQNVTSVPLQAAHVAFEVYSKDQRYYLRVSYNGDVIEIPELKSSGHGMYLLHDFHSHFDPLFNHCPSMP
jgi:acid phosphatase